MTVDVAVIGGGPAGAAAALTLRRYSDFSVAVLERGAYLEPRIGETIGPGVQPLLTFLGVWEQFSGATHRRSYSTAAAWGSEEVFRQEFIFSGRGDGWHLDRPSFDRMLAEAVLNSGGELIEQASVNEIIRKKRGGWQITVRDTSERVLKINARFLIDATGRRGFATRRLGSERIVIDDLVGVIGFVETTHEKEIEHDLLVEACPNGWWYSADLPKRRMVVAFMSDADLVRDLHAHKIEGWRNLLGTTLHTQKRVPDARFSEKLLIRAAASYCLKRPAGDRWLAVGDAAAAFDPLSSMGIGHALSSGSHGARVAYDSNAGDGKLLLQYLRGVKENFENFLAIRRRFYSLEQRWAARPFWRRRHVPDITG